MKIVALVPMRHHSERVPGKNYRLLGGTPLYQYIIRTLLAVPEIDEIVIDTDSPVIMEGLRTRMGAELAEKRLTIIQRPEHLRDDKVPMNEILAYDTSQVEADLYIQTHSTNPLLRSETIQAAIQRLLENYPTFDSLFSVTRLQTRLWDQLGRAVNHNPAILLRTQDLPPIYEENSCIYIFSRPILLSHRNRLGDRPMMYEIDPDEAWDIDEELDFEIVDWLVQRTGRTIQEN